MGGEAPHQGPEVVLVMCIGRSGIASLHHHWRSIPPPEGVPPLETPPDERGALKEGLGPLGTIICWFA
jgi:hypothetical protein